MLARSLARQASACTAQSSSSVQRVAVTSQAQPSTSYNIHTSAWQSAQAKTVHNVDRAPATATKGPIPPSAMASMSPARRKRLIQERKKENIERSELLERQRTLTAPDPVLGHQLNQVGEQYWLNSELRKVVLTKDEIWGVTGDSRGNLVSLMDAQHSEAGQELRVSDKRLNFGLDSEINRQLLFSELPAVVVEDSTRTHSGAVSPQSIAALANNVEKVEQQEQANVGLLRRVLDLRNASGKGIQVENIRRIREHFGTRPGDERPGMDTGSVETQVAILTYRIRNLHEHLSTARHDNHNRRGMAGLVHQRKRLLKYLREKSPERYAAILPRIGVEARAVEGEVIVPGKPLLNKRVGA